MSTPAILRERLEDQRRQTLHRQIGAIRTKLDHWSKCKCAFHDRQFAKLWAKERRLQAELRQPMLVLID